MLDHVKVEVLEPVMVTGLPDEKTLQASLTGWQMTLPEAPGEQYSLQTCFFPISEIWTFQVIPASSFVT